MTNSLTIGFIGLGTMGAPMAGHLVSAGHTVQAFNRSHQRAAAWQQRYPQELFPQVHRVDSIAKAAANASIVFTCVGNIDAPVSGGQAGAENGQLAIMAGGDAEVFARVEPVIAAYAKRSQLIGDVGAGQLTKMVNQICFTGVVAGLAEGLFFAEKAGLDTQAVLNVVSQGAAQSWQMDNRAQTMLRGEYDFGFAVDWVRKDLGIVLEEAKNIGCELSGVKQINDYYGELQQLGLGRSDTSALLERLRRR